MGSYLLYIDPGAMTYLIQIIAGVVIVAGATLGFYWRRIRRYYRKRKEQKLEAKINSGTEEHTP